MGKVRQIVEVKFDNEAEQNFEYLVELDAPLAPDIDLEKNLLFAVINREEYIKNGNIIATPLCDKPNIYRVVRVVKIKNAYDQEYDGQLKYIVGLFTPEEYIKRISNHRRAASLRKMLERRRAKLEEKKKFESFAKEDTSIAAILEEINKLED